MHFFAVTGLLVMISNLSMAVWVYLKGRTKRLNVLWARFLIPTSIWGFGGYKYTTALDKTGALLWTRIAYVGVILIPVMFTHFVFTFLNIRRRKTLLALYLLAIFFIIVSFLSKELFLGELGFIFSSFYWVTSPGPIWYLFLFYFMGLIACCEYKLFKGYRASFGSRRNQMKYFNFATLLGFSSGAMCFLPCFGINLYPGIGNIGVSIYCIPMAYAIVKYRLMDIRVAITRTGIFVAVYALILGIPFAVASRFKEQFIYIFGSNWWMVFSGSIIVLATVATLAYVYLQRKAEDALLKEQRRYQATLKEAAAEMTRIHNLQKLLNLIVEIVTKNINISHSAIYVYDENDKKFVLKAAYKSKNNQPLLINLDNSIVKWLQDQKEVLVYEEARQKFEDEQNFIFKELKEQMQSLNAAIIVPSFLEGRLLNLLILGEKISGAIYTPEDLGIFSILASQIAIAIENASLYENIEEQVRQRTDELIQTQKQLIQAEKLATVGTLAGGVAHEINNPLSAVLTNAQMLLMSAKDEEDKESLKLIEDAAKRCRSIVQKLMVYSRKPLGGRELTDVDLEKALNNALSLLNYQLTQDNIKINATLKNPPFIVKGSQNELEQVFTNLILNAKDAIKHLKKLGQIDISITRTGNTITIKIKDDGIGIPKERISKIFDPFYTTKDVGKGTGLGLSICQSIIESHNGKITFESEEGKGTTFIIILPTGKKKE